MTNTFSDLMKSTNSIVAAYQKMRGALVESIDDDDLDERHSGWKERMTAAHPDKKIVFRSSNTGGEHMISAEEHGDASRKALGLFNVKTGEQHIYHESAESDQLVSSSVKHMGKTYSTFGFTTPDAANKFMSSPAGANYGFLVIDDHGVHHCADMNDEGTDA